MELPPFLRRHIELIMDKDLDGMMANYHPDAVVVRPGAAYRGVAEIRPFFASYLDIAPRVVQVYASEGTEDLIVYHARMSTDRGEQDSVGTLALRDGLIWRQTVLSLEGS
jgi:ketosteroid isomerase-like protein